MTTLTHVQLTVVDQAGNVQPFASIQVNHEVGGALATIKPNRDGSGTLANAFPADSVGFAAFYVAGGLYKITATLGSFTKEWRNVAIGTAQECDIDTDVTLAANSDLVVPTQKAVKAYVDALASAPAIKTGTSYSVAAADVSLIINASGTFTLTLPDATLFPKRWLHLKSIAAQTVNSASSNVKPIATDTAGTAILTSTAGKWCALQSNGAHWVVMSSN